MNTKRLTAEEREFLQTVAENILGPIRARVQISERPVTLYWFIKGNGERREWEEYSYPIFIFSERGNIEFSERFHENAELVQSAWMIAHRAFKEFDGDHDGELAENLWPSDNGHLPDYKRFMPDDN